MSLNDFFSRFETLQYSLNHADESYSELEPVKAGMDVKYYEEREKILKRKVELNDKQKVVHLLNMHADCFKVPRPMVFKMPLRYIFYQAIILIS